MGVPVTNCDGRDTNVTDTSSGSITVGRTWSVDTTVGLAFGPLKMEAKGGWSQTKSTEWSQSIAITVEPGQMVCYTQSKQQTHTYDGILGCLGCKHTIPKNERDCTDRRWASFSYSRKYAVTLTLSIFREDFPLVSNQPVNVISYGPASVPCGSQFGANISSSFNCTSNAQMWRKGNTPSATSLAPMTAVILLSILLVA